MSFEQPLQLAWLALVVPVVLLYLRYGLRKKYDASTLAIWQHALKQRTLWSRWRRLVSIAAACMPVVLVALALARPELTIAKSAPRSIVVIVDNTASMNATDVRPSRLREAKSAAHDLVESLRTHETMAILSADSFTHAHCGLTDDTRVLQAALGQVQPTDGAGDLSLAIATAERMLSGQANPVVVVLSDKVDDSLRESSRREHIVLQQFGKPTSNLAITQFAARPLPTGGQSQEVFVEVSNFSDAAATTNVQLSLSGGTAQAIPFSIPAGERLQRVVPLRVERGGLLTAKLDSEDALAADNTAQLLVMPSGSQQVGFTSTLENSATAIALASVPGLTVSNGGDGSVIILEGAAPAKLPPQPLLVIGPTTDSDLWEIVGTLESPLAATQADHPLLAGVDLRRVVIDRAVKLKMSGAGQVLAATAAGDPLLVIVPHAGGDVIVLAFNPQDSDLPLRGDFPRLIANALAVLQGSSATEGVGLTTRDVAAGARLTPPFGDWSQVDIPLVAAVVHAGAWRAEAADGSAVLPVNLVQESESDLRAASATEVPSRVPSPRLPDIGPLWRWLVGLAVVWVLGQWVFYQRREID